MSQLLWQYTTTLANGNRCTYDIYLNAEYDTLLDVTNTSCGYVNNNKGVIEIYTTALLNFSPSTINHPKQLYIENGLKVTITVIDGKDVGWTETSFSNFSWGLYTLENGSYYHATRLTAQGTVEGTNSIVGLLFDSNIKAIQYMNGLISPLDALNGLKTTWKCYWTGNKSSGYNLKINWECENVEKYSNVNDYNILIGTCGKAYSTTYPPQPNQLIKVENYISVQYTSSEINLNSNQIKSTFNDRVEGATNVAYFYLTLTLYDKINDKYNYTVGIKFMLSGPTKYEIVTDSYIIESDLYNGNGDGSLILFYNELGDDDLGYNARKDEVENLTTGTYGRGKGFISTYALDNSRLNSIGSAIWNDTFNQNIFKVNSSPIENCVSTMKFPFAVGDTNGEVYIGNVDMETQGGISINNGIIEIGTFTLNPIYDNFLDFAPFSKTLIYLPFVGYQELPISEMIGRTYTLKYITDYITGECNAVIYYKDAPFLVFSGVIGIEIPISNQGIANLNRSQFPSLVSSATSAIQQNPIGSVNGLVSAMTEVQHPTTNGVASSECNAKTCVTAFLLRIYPQWQEPANYAHQYGKPCNLSRKLNGLTGFTVVAPDFDTSGLNDIATDELNEIREIMTNGFYI